MDQKTLQKLSRLRIMAGKEGKEMDLVRFVSDHAYALETLQRILDSDKEEVVLLGMEVMDIMGLIPAKAAANDASGEATEKYVHSLR